MAVNFVPGRIALPGCFSADTMTAGSTTLLLQIALPLLLFAAQPGTTCSTLVLVGGTNASLAPQIDYAKHVFLPFLQRHFAGMGNVQLEIERRGYFPRGGGEVRVDVAPVCGDARLGPARVLERGGVTRVEGIAHFAKLPTRVGRDMVLGAKRRLELVGELNQDVTVDIQYKRENDGDSAGAGSGIVLWAVLEGGGVIGGSAVGRKGLDAVQVGEAAAAELVRGLEAGGCVDEVRLFR